MIERVYCVNECIITSQFAGNLLYLFVVACAICMPAFNSRTIHSSVTIVHFSLNCICVFINKNFPICIFLFVFTYNFLILFYYKISKFHLYQINLYIKKNLLVIFVAILAQYVKVQQKHHFTIPCQVHYPKMFQLLRKCYVQI